jgi:hypothetical protein
MRERPVAVRARSRGRPPSLPLEEPARATGAPADLVTAAGARPARAPAMARLAVWPPGDGGGQTGAWWPWSIAAAAVGWNLASLRALKLGVAYLGHGRQPVVTVFALLGFGLAWPAWSSDAGARALLVALAVSLLLVCPGSDAKRLIINRAARAGGGENPARPRWRCR